MNKPAPYTPTTPAELEAVNTLSYILDSTLVKCFFNKHDKIPNHDGHIELTDEKQFPTGQFLVQIKKMNVKKGLKYSVDRAFINYCIQAQLPFLLFLVDVDSASAYWNHLSTEFLSTLNLGSQNTHTVYFTPDKTIKKGYNSFLPEWNAIIREEREVKLKGKELLAELKEMKGALNRAKKVKDRSYQKTDTKFSAIQSYLDYYNGLLDREFNAIKKIFFPGVWKMGVAIGTFEPNRLEYIKYPVPEGTNDTLIKVSALDNKKRIDNLFEGSVGYFRDNPILTRPEEYAYEVVKGYFDKALDKDYFPSEHPVFLNELVIQFVDDFAQLLGLEAGLSSYSLKELADRFDRFIPLLLEGLGLADESNPHNFANLDGLIIYGNIKSLGTKLKVAQTRFMRGDRPDYDIILLSDHYDLWFVRNAIDTLAHLNGDTLTSFFSYRFLSFSDGLRNISPNDIETFNLNIHKFYEYLPAVYDDVIKRYFPLLFEPLKYFADTDLTMILTGKEFDPSFVRGEGYELNEIYLKSSATNKMEKISVYVKGIDEMPLTKRELHAVKEIRLDNITYEKHGWTQGVPDFLFERTPFASRIKKLLKERFEKYFSGMIGRH